ncbi:hypothetical protein AUJ69_01655 [Candidatus Woesearchaeota archaeon CG1_02_47_18]|nr:MAG: hypothetical protein AUJ69_01655 [Candidatus Woesearchaeota archaeon CG1_02_47_18]HII29991.1 radical SAM protein [Candidatus Woesearchaeota archaeon]
MRIAFIYINPMGLPYVSHGIASLSAAVKKQGHKARLIDFTFGLSTEHALSGLASFNPGLICFTGFSNEFNEVARFASLCRKQFKAVIICGGVHATIAPEDVISAGFDGVCIGEGELPLAELAAMIELGKDFLHVRNFWFRSGEGVIKNRTGLLVEELDTLPFPDYSIFDMKSYLAARDGQLDVKTSRGCPFSCSYCINNTLKCMYSGRYFRLFSVDWSLANLARLKRMYSIRNFFIVDETFNANAAHMAEFCRRYPEEVGVPFECELRADLCTEETFSQLKRAGCFKVSIAIESGDEGLRMGLLNKRITDRQIIRAFSYARKFGISTQSFNIVGLPLETRAQIRKTIELNKAAKPDSIQVTIFTPYKGTALHKYVVEKGLLKRSDIDVSYYLATYLRNPGLSERELIRIRKWFSYCCYEDRSRIKACLLLFREYVTPYYLKFGRVIPVWFKKLIYRYIWHSRMLNFLSK